MFENVNLSEEPKPQAPAPSPIENTTYQNAPVEPEIKSEPILQPQARPKSKTVFFIIALIVLVIAGVGGWFWYAQGEALLLTNQMKWSWGIEKDLENFNSSGEISLDLLFDKSAVQPNDNNVSSALDYIDLSGGAEKTTAKVNLGMDIDKVANNLEASLKMALLFGTDKEPESIKMDIELNNKLVDDNYYLQIVKADGLATFPLLALLGITDIKLDNSWVKVDYGKGEFEKYLSNQQSDQNIEKEFNNFIKEVKKRKLIKVVDPHETSSTPSGQLKKINYQIISGKEQEFMDFITEYFAILKDPSADLEKIRSENEKFYKDNPLMAEDLKNTMSKITLSLWVNKKNKLIQGFDISLSNTVITLEDKTKATISFRVYNKIESIPFKEIVTPDSSISAEEFVQKITSQSMFNNFSQATSSDLNLDSDNDGLIGYEETYYGTNLNNPDTDGDGYLDGEEVDNGYNPLGEGKLFAPPIVDYEYGNTWATSGDPEVFKKSCQSGGGQWTIVDPEAYEICSQYTSKRDCENISNCAWASAEWPNNGCISYKYYCVDSGGKGGILIK